MQIVNLYLVPRHLVEVDEPRGRLGTGVSLGHDDAFVDGGILTQILLTG